MLSTELGDYITRVGQKYVDKRNDGELFREWVLRADEEDLL